MITRADHAAEVARLTAPILEQIQRAVVEKNVSWQVLARTSGISRETISQTVANRAAPPSLVTIVAICRALGLRVTLGVVPADQEEVAVPYPPPLPVPSTDPTPVAERHQVRKPRRATEEATPEAGAPPTSSAWLTTSELARLAGIAPGQLLVWSDRYGWPPTHRGQHGERRFDISVVDDLREVVRLRNRGRPIRVILATGVPQLAPAAPKRKLLSLPEMIMSTVEGRSAHRIIESAFSSGQSRTGIAAVMQTALPRVPEPDRSALQKLIDCFPE